MGQLQSNDPNIAGIRVAQNAPNVVRLVIDLKQPIVPQVFHLEPVAAYQHRLVFDLYPANPPDPLEQLISQRLQELDEASSRAARLLGLEARELGASVKAEPDPLGELIAQRDRPKLPTSPSAPTSTPRSAAIEPASKPRTPAAQRAAEDQPPPLPQTERLIVIALDPGHGGEDPGAIGPGGTREKDVVLKIAKMLRERINASSVGEHPMRAFLTRDADFFVPLHVRVQKARRVQADLFVSIHADAFYTCLLYTSPSPRDVEESRMPSSA